ncbi:MAG: phosphotransferase [Propionicimonas sp.]
MSTASAWEAYLRQARWFGGKGLAATVTAIEPLVWYTAPGQWPAVRSEIATISYADARVEQYQLLVAYLPAGSAPAGLPVGRTTLPGLGEVDFVDAPAYPAAMSALIDALLTRAPEGMRWQDATPVDATAAMRLFTGEQSNTTVLVGETTLFKLFRKLEPGRNLDAEVLGALSGSGITPDLYGSLSAGGFDLAMFCQRVQGVTDGWLHATAACATGRDISPECHQLGVELAHLHRLLAAAFGTAERPGADVAAAMVRRFDAAATQVGELEDYRQAAQLLFASTGTELLATQRVHGDFHLGQVLYREAAQEWVIIDFEGEPLKTLAERREFDSVWRDVAGLLRSLDYARSAHPDPDGHATRDWCARASAAFLDGYRGRHDDEPPLLRAYELDKAVYEVVYEMRNRPDWAHIPWRAVQDEARRVSLNPPEPTDKEQ